MVLLYSTVMRAYLLIIILLISAVAEQSFANSHAHILPFKVWKQKKIDDAKNSVAELKRQMHKTQIKTDDDDDTKLDLAQRLSQADLNLGVARDLSANDYFLLYVAPQFKDNNEALIQAAKNLTPRDVADILTAYQKRLQNQELFNTDSGTGGTLADPTPSLEKTAKAP